MKNYRKYILWCGGAVYLLAGEQAAAMTCDVTPDCVALGFKVPAAEVKGKCNGQSRMKCPFGDFYFCSEKKCEESDYPYTAANCTYSLGGSTCDDSLGKHYKECIENCDTSKYPYTSSNCSYQLSGSSCTDGYGKHYSSCNNPCSGYGSYNTNYCASYSSCYNGERTMYRCSACKGTCMSGPSYDGICYNGLDKYYPSSIPAHATSYTTCVDSDGVTRYKVTACESPYKNCNWYCASPSEGGFCEV